MHITGIQVVHVAHVRFEGFFRARVPSAALTEVQSALDSISPRFSRRGTFGFVSLQIRVRGELPATVGALDLVSLVLEFVVRAETLLMLEHLAARGAFVSR